MNPIIIIVAAFFGVAALVGAVAMLFRGGRAEEIEQRLDVLTGATRSPGASAALAEGSVLAKPLDDTQSAVASYIARFFNLSALINQADVGISVSKFLMLTLGFAIAGGAVLTVARVHPAAVPAGAAAAGALPLAWLLFKRKQRLSAFAKQLPEALELLARALRAGHSLAAGFDLVQGEMSNPLAKEFGRVYEEQNLGIPLEEALDDMADRVPNLDLRFFCTAVILQRQTGGDLAEILDKIGELVRERFKIWGQVQALTGEGRLSGIVLLALPPVLFLTMFRLNPQYVMKLFTDPLGTRMLLAAIALQIAGALVIRKIINIKV